MKATTRIAYASADATPPPPVDRIAAALDNAAVHVDFDAVVGEHRRVLRQRNAGGGAANDVRRRPLSMRLDGLRRAVSQPFLGRGVQVQVVAVHDDQEELKNSIHNNDPFGDESIHTSSAKEQQESLSDADLLPLFSNNPESIVEYRVALKLDGTPEGALPRLMKPVLAKDVDDQSSGAKKHILKLREKHLVAISPHIGLYGNIISNLDLSSNSLKVIPPEIGYLKNLQWADFSNNKLETIPTTIAHCTKLRELACSQNALTCIPTTIGSLHQLSTLDFSRNQLTIIPQEIGLINTLQDLDLSQNQIKYLPVELFRLKTLYRLDTTDCPLLTEMDYEEIMVKIEDGEEVYNPPTLQELAARVLHRHQTPVLKHMQTNLKALLNPSNVSCCSCCSGPLIDYEVIRWRKVIKDGTVILGRERLCWRHWDTEAERVVAMFRRKGWTAPVVLPPPLPSIRRDNRVLVDGGAGGSGGGALRTRSISERIRSRASSSSLRDMIIHPASRRPSALDLEATEMLQRVSLHDEHQNIISLPPLVLRQPAPVATTPSSKPIGFNNHVHNTATKRKSILRHSQSLASFF
ncbi:hypothetical protein BDR26DRAFT_721847 [Obelidium mucronatum]|nr:hypothetical protein BDR26DRAFT_721847 [Obelidium mucronatum]